MNRRSPSEARTMLSEAEWWQIELPPLPGEALAASLGRYWSNRRSRKRRVGHAMVRPERRPALNFWAGDLDERRVDAKSSAAVVVDWVRDTDDVMFIDARNQPWVINVRSRRIRKPSRHEWRLYDDTEMASPEDREVLDMYAAAC